MAELKWIFGSAVGYRQILNEQYPEYLHTEFPIICINRNGSKIAFYVEELRDRCKKHPNKRELLDVCVVDTWNGGFWMFARQRK